MLQNKHFKTLFTALSKRYNQIKPGSRHGLCDGLYQLDITLKLSQIFHLRYCEMVGKISFVKTTLKLHLGIRREH